MSERATVIVTPELWGVTSGNGGISTSVFHFARLFASRGDHVRVLVGLAKEASVLEPWSRRYEDAGIEVCAAVPGRPESKADRDPYSLEYPFRRISEAVAESISADADVVYFQDWCALGYECLRRRILGPATSGPRIVTVLRGSSAWATAWEPRPTGDESGAALARAESFALEHSDFVVSPSRAYLETVAGSEVPLPDGGRTRVLPHPWLPFREALAAPTRQRSFRQLVYFGRIETRKGVDLFLDALASLASSTTCLAGIEEVVFVGREGVHRRESLDRVEAEVASLGLVARFVTDLDSWGVADLLLDAAADSLVVVPSLRENFPNAVIEVSLTPGLSALYSDVGGVREMLGDQARAQLFAPDVDGLTSALAGWLRDGPRGQDALASYDWRRANERWLRFHEDVLGEAGSARSPRRPRREVRSADPKLGIIVSTYEWPAALEAVLWSLSEQSDPDFEVIVADDGSGAGTSTLVEQWQTSFEGRLSHVWQPDLGFRRTRALDLAVLASDARYLVMIDGDAIPRRHFVRALRAAARPGWFVAGRRMDLSRSLTARVLERQARVHEWTLARWLRSRRDATGLLALTHRDRRRVGVPGAPEFAPVDRAYGFLLGVARRDLERVNGLDTRYVGWGEEDVDLALRLRRLGLRCGHAGPDATVLHLWHPTREVHDRPNWWLLHETEKSERIEAVVGLRELRAELLAAQASAKRVTASSSSGAPAKS